MPNNLERLLAKAAAVKISPAELDRLRRALTAVEALRLMVDSSDDPVIGRWAGRLDPSDAALAQLQRRDADPFLPDLGGHGWHRSRRHATHVLMVGHGGGVGHRPSYSAVIAGSRLFSLVINTVVVDLAWQHL